MHEFTVHIYYDGTHFKTEKLYNVPQINSWIVWPEQQLNGRVAEVHQIRIDEFNIILAN